MTDDLARAHIQMQRQGELDAIANEQRVAADRLEQRQRRDREIEAARVKAEKAEQARRQEERAAAETEQARVDALSRWLLAGGTPGSFSEQWPAIRREQLRAAALSGQTEFESILAAKRADPMYDCF